MAHGVEVEYTLSVSARTPQQSTGPIIAELGELTPVGNISYADDLFGEGEASLSVEPESVVQDVADRLKDLKNFPTELDIYRGDARIWRGPILSCQLQGPTLTLNARGLLYYLKYMTLEADLLYESLTDQYSIGKGLIDAYQALDFGNYGIDTSGIGLSGITRIKRYPFIENQNVYNRLFELAQVGNGFDAWINPEDRKLMFAAAKGSDKTQSVYADIGNIINPNVFWSVAHGNVASDGIAVGVSDDGATPSVVGTQNIPATRSSWGRSTFFQTREDVTQQATIDDYAQKIVDARAEQLLVPGPSVVTIKDVDPTTLETGDTIPFTMEIGTLGTVGVVRRVQYRRTTVNAEGVEDMELTLV